MSGYLNQQFPSRTTAFVDPKTGIMSPVWYNLNRSLWLRTGGGIADATANELQTQITAQEVQITSANTNISANTAAISTLSTNVATNYAPKTSPALSGVPIAPTAAPGTNTTQLATTAFVAAFGTYTLPTATAVVLGGVKPDGTTITNTAGAISVAYGTTGATAAAGNDSRITGALSVATAAATYAPLASPTFTGSPVVPGYLTTATAATTYAPLASPAFTGTVTGGNVITTTGTANAIASITVTASPFAYTATARGQVYLSAGTVSSVTLKRGATTIATGILAGAFDVASNDVLTVTYAVAPTMNFVPL